MFWTSIPGVTKNPYSSWGYEINLVWFRLLLSVTFPHMELRVSPNLVSPRYVGSSLCAVGSLRSDRTGECIGLHCLGFEPS